MRPYGLVGKPLLPLSVTSVQLLPPSALRNRPLPLGLVESSPPERNVQPLRRKSHRPANSTCGFCASIDSEAQPVDRFGPLRISDQVLPPSDVLYRPRSAESLHSLPGTQA